MELAKLSMISLQRQALTKFASLVWVSANKQSLRYHLCFRLNRESLNNRAIDDLKHSNIPTLFKEMITMILNDVGYEIYHWLFEIKNQLTTTILEHQVSNLSWTVEGLLNQPKMTRLLLENQTDLDLSFSFRMACIYCLEDKVREMWPRIREERQFKHFKYENLMVKYWIYKLDRLDGHLLDPTHNSFLGPLLVGTSVDVQFFVRVANSFEFGKVTVKFLFNNLTEEEKIQALNIFILKPSKYTRDDHLQLSDVPSLGYLLSQLNYTQMCGLVSKFELPEGLMNLLLFFAWPNTHILKALDHCIGKMKGAIESTNENDLVEFADGAFKFVRRYNCSILFRYCWTRFPREVLNEAIDSIVFEDIISELADKDDAVSIKIVIDSIDPKSYARNLLSDYHISIIETLAPYDTDLLKYYLTRTVVSKNLAKNLLNILKGSEYLQPIKETTTGILIQLFPELDPNCSD